MIAYLRGKVIFKGEKFVVIDVNGVGYRVFTGPGVVKSVKKQEEVKLWVHLYVREDTLALYGFLEYAELDFFEALIQISGIGPKSALGILAVAPLDNLKKAIATGETSYLVKVSGIGRKIADKIILELKDKLGGIGFNGEGAGYLKEDEDVLSVLRSLGYSYQEIREVLTKLPFDIQGVQGRIKEALKILGKN